LPEGKCSGRQLFVEGKPVQLISHGVAAGARSLDHLVGAGEKSWRDREAGLFRGLEVDDEIELHRLLDGKVAGVGSLQDAST